MQFNPKEAWQSVRVLYGGDTSHHNYSTIMHMRPPNWELETTDAENASVFGPHFHRVFNNNIHIYWPVMDKIKQIDIMEELDQPISWDEMKNPPNI